MSCMGWAATQRHTEIPILVSLTVFQVLKKHTWLPGGYRLGQHRSRTFPWWREAPLDRTGLAEWWKIGKALVDAVQVLLFSLLCAHLQLSTTKNFYFENT